MRGWALVTIVALGAGRSFGPPGDSTAIVDGEVFDTRTGEDAVDDDAPIADAKIADGALADADPDEDGDGILDPTDLCPHTTSPNNHDHDGDGVGDVCDPCPHLPAPSGGPDTDHDGVGDACDPDAGANDDIALFEGFYDAASIANLPHDAWTVAGGHATIEARGVTDFHFITWPVIVHRAAVTTAFIAHEPGTNDIPGFGTFAGVQTPGANLSASVCGLGIQGNARLYTARFENGAQSDQQLAVLGGAITEGTTYVLHHDVTSGGNGNHCEAVMPPKAVDAVGRTDAAGQVSVFAYRYHVDLDYIFVVERAP